jgi:hypothetical protein
MNWMETGKGRRQMAIVTLMMDDGRKNILLPRG